MTARRSRQDTPTDGSAGRLRARPFDQAAEEQPAPGLQRLGLSEDRDGLLYVPSGFSPERRWPLAVLLHGAGSDAPRGIAPLLEAADDAGLVLLAPGSRAQTWDVLLGGYGPDVVFLDAALAQTFARVPVDAARLAIGGFSDGASYALSLGIGNGDLFTHVLAFSPGFAAPPGQVGHPRVFVSHGSHDRVLPIGRCSRRLVPALRSSGYEVRYEEFDGPHVVPADIAQAALLWFLQPPAGTCAGNASP